MAPAQNSVFKALKGSWEDLHEVRVVNTASFYDRLGRRIYRLAATSLSLNSKDLYIMPNESTLATLCVTLAAFDTYKRFMSFSVWSPHLGAATGCMHGDPTKETLNSLTGYITTEEGINGTYYVDPKTFFFQRPLKRASNFSIARPQVMERVHAVYTSTPLFENAERYYNGTIDSIDPKTMWAPDPTAPHLLYFNLPAALVLRGLSIYAGPNTANFLRVGLNGLTLSRSASFPLSLGEKLAVFVNASLSTSDPLIMSNSWGQAQSADKMGTFGNLDHTPLPYLACSNVSDPLMRTALKHVNLKLLQQDGYKHTSWFRYKGAYATVTAWSYTTPIGLTVPFVYVSPQNTILPPHVFYARLVMGIFVGVFLLIVAVFWAYIHFRFTRPLRRISELLDQSVATGQRIMFRQDRPYFFRNTEVEELVAAHNACMRRLREIDTFVPQPLRASATGSHDTPAHAARGCVFGGPAADGERGASAHHRQLMAQQSTIATVTIRPPPNARTTSAVAVCAAQLQARRVAPSQLLDDVVATAACASNMVNSGPFPSPAALEAFATAVGDLVALHRGMVLRFSPDGCVVHFGGAVRAHLLSPAVQAVQAAQAVRSGGGELSPQQCLNAAAVRREAAACVRRDAADAVAFALAVQAWTARCRRSRMPDVRVLLDTSTFTCGVYRNELSGQVMPVALGRDVHREVGHVAQRIGVRVAMTEETASLVRARVCGLNTRRVDAGVRQVPVEALRVGRVGLDADVVILYEVLPGAVAGNAAWQLYQRYCFDGFGFMVHGEYGAALGAYRRVADISDLEPGLLPHSLRREAAASSVVGGAVSVQVQRLIDECERRLRAGVTEKFRRTRHCPLGIDAVLRGVDYAPARDAAAAAHRTQPRATAPRHRPRVPRESAAPAFRTPGFAVERAIVTAHDSTGARPHRYVLGGKPEWLEDNHGSYWYVPKSPNHMMWADPWNVSVPVLGSAGVLCAMTVMPLREVAAEVAEALGGAPDGVMTDAVSRAVPTCTPTPGARAAAERMYIKKQAITHPNLLSPVAYSFSIEGCVAVINECSPGGTLRCLYDRYGAVRPLTTARFTLDILAGLACLHRMGLAHGALSLANVTVDGNGVCRLSHHFLRSRQDANLVRVPDTLYVSPAMAAGHPPTPQCDIFCYGLLCIEMVARRPCWMWASADAEHEPGKAKELRELLRRGGQPFYDAVVQKRVVPASSLMRVPEVMASLSESDHATTRACFSYDAAERPTALQLRAISARVLEWHGFTEEAKESLNVTL